MGYIRAGWGGHPHRSLPRLVYAGPLVRRLTTPTLFIIARPVRVTRGVSPRMGKVRRVTRRDRLDTTHIQAIPACGYVCLTSTPSTATDGRQCPARIGERPLVGRHHATLQEFVHSPKGDPDRKRRDMRAILRDKTP